jgi:RNA polymerase sigma-70 factor (ECF subfamily)
MKHLIYSGFNDEQLINELLKGDKNCFGVLYSRYYSKVYSRCITFTGNNDDAFDMTQDVLLKAICNVGSFGGHSKFSTWLYAIANNYCITQSGKKSRNYLEHIDAAHQIQDEQMEEAEYQERIKREALESNLDEYLNLLTDEERKMLILKYRKNYSVKELQKEFDLSSSAVKMRLLRARMKMGQLINLEEAA